MGWCNIMDLKHKFCKEPWNFLSVGHNYSTPCCYINTNIGKVTTDNIFDVWNSKEAKEVRRSILDGDFKHCKHNICPYIQDGTLPNRDSHDPNIRTIIDNYILECSTLPRYIHLCNDQSCNLHCTSCRKEKITEFLNADEYKQNAEFQVKLLELIKNKPAEEVLINITGSGDPFASRLYREFLFNIDGEQYPNLRIGLQTNGVLMTPKYWNRIERIHKNINHIIISFDAATKKVYDQVRLGGNWELLNENIKHLREQKRLHGYDFCIVMSFILQQKNYRELPQFVELANEYGFTPSIFLIYPWYDSPFFTEAMVYNENHPEYLDFLEVLRNPIFDKYPIKWGNVARYRNLAITKI